MIHPEGEERMPMKFIISETDEILVSHSGLGLAGALLQGTGMQKRSNDIRLGDRKRPEVSHGDVVTAMIGLLCLGKPDFGAIEAFRLQGREGCLPGLPRAAGRRPGVWAQTEFPDPRSAGFPGRVYAAHSAQGRASDPLLRLVLEQGRRHASQGGRAGSRGRRQRAIAGFHPRPL